ncbi:hypothetical protein H8N01_07930 [Streptomyces sp. AC536]|uniref:hypothetical protein n=1 Tax=Streptomyces buecherae TaxID=2763006 RepID=UPI00164D07B9|nr:hypothetical protein [Streptomyces buecherae]MBC3982491.1 hypothetical protein [Streptomyces buecherae]QNJ38735.1 hypothetical protein H7H31_01515 [Streptomyces buecherae]
MWPGQQPPGGEQNPQDQNPYQQPGYPQTGPPGQPGPYQTPAPGQPNPYQQPVPPPGAQPGPPGPPGAPHQGAPQPGPYQQPGYPQQTPPPQTWNAPAGPGAPQPPQGGGDKRKKTIAIVTASAVVAAAAVAGVVIFSGDDGDDKKDSAKESPKPSASAPSQQPGGSQAPSGGPDNPRGGSDNPRSGDPAAKPVIPGWKTVISAKRHVAFDVPDTADWKVESAGLSVGFESDKGKPLVIMSSPAKYKQDACSVKVEGSTRPDTSDLGGVGTKGALGAKSEASAAEIEAENWVFAGYDQKQTGQRKVTKAKPFQSDHGLKGYAASATVTGVKKTDKCSSDGKSFTVAYTDVNGDYALWVLHAAAGVKDELPNETIEKIKSTLRPLKSNG